MNSPRNNQSNETTANIQTAPQNPKQFEQVESTIDHLVQKSSQEILQQVEAAEDAEIPFLQSWIITGNYASQPLTHRDQISPNFFETLLTSQQQITGISLQYHEFRKNGLLDMLAKLKAKNPQIKILVYGYSASSQFFQDLNKNKFFQTLVATQLSPNIRFCTNHPDHYVECDNGPLSSESLLLSDKLWEDGFSAEWFLNQMSLQTKDIINFQFSTSKKIANIPNYFQNYWENNNIMNSDSATYQKRLIDYLDWQGDQFDSINLFQQNISITIDPDNGPQFRLNEKNISRYAQSKIAQILKTQEKEFAQPERFRLYINVGRYQYLATLSTNFPDSDSDSDSVYAQRSFVGSMKENKDQTFTPWCSEEQANSYFPNNTDQFVEDYIAQSQEKISPKFQGKEAQLEILKNYWKKLLKYVKFANFSEYTNFITKTKSSLNVRNRRIVFQILFDLSLDQIVPEGVWTVQEQ